MCDVRKRLDLGTRGRVACYRQGRNNPEAHTVEILQKNWRRRDRIGYKR